MAESESFIETYFTKFNIPRIVAKYKTYLFFKKDLTFIYIYMFL